MNLRIDKSKWEKVCLGDVAFEYSKRINNPSESEYERFVGSSNIGQWDFRVKSWESTESVTSAMKEFEPNDYLLVRRSLYASDFRERAPRAHFHGVCSGDILTIKENPEYIADGFLIGIFNSPDLWKYVVANASGSITRRIKWKDLSNYEFLLPPKEQQAQLAELLWTMDEVIEKEMAVFDRLEIQRKTLHEKDFSNYRKSKFKIGKFVSKVGSGVTPKGGSKVYQEAGVRLIRSQNVLFGEFDFSDVAFISNEIDEKMKSSRVREDDVLLNITGASIGRSAVYHDSEKANVNQHVCIIRTNINLDSHFLCEFLNSQYGQKQIQLLQAGGNREGLNFANIKLMKFPEYSFEQQSQVQVKYGSITTNFFNARKQIAKSKALQKSLINQIF